MPASYRIELFGCLRVYQNGRVIRRFHTQKTASLLAFLAYHPDRPHPREVLIEMLWPGGIPEAGRASLRQSLAALRRQLEPPGVARGTLIQADRFSVRLNPAAFTCDALDFTRAVANARRATTASERSQALYLALALYCGEFLPGFYEDWVVHEQRRLEGLHEQALAEWDLLAEKAHEVSPETADTEGSPTLLQPSEQGIDPRLPLRLTRFFGRRQEITWLAEQVQGGTRLITLIGCAGSGKTRLAIEAAEQMAGYFHGRVWFVPLAEVTGAEQFSAAIVDALGLPHSSDGDEVVQAAEMLSAAPSLLILDNFEQLVESAAKGLQALLDRVASLSLLITSRRVLNLEGEHEFAVQPLPVAEREAPPERLILLPSVQLFVDRAQAARPDFQLTRRNAPVLADLSRRLEGLPLAIELAAARAQVLSPAQILEQLNRPFEFLVTRRRGSGDRHRSLHAAVEWSYGLLSSDLQRFFRCLSVFRSGWTLEAAQAVCDEPNALEFLERLHEASMVTVEETDAGTRFRMLETMREFASERHAPRDVMATRQRHVDYFLALAEKAAARRLDRSVRLWHEYLEPDRENLRMAFENSLADPRGPEAAARLAASLYEFWLAAGALPAVRPIYERVVERARAEGSPTDQARALVYTANVAGATGDHARKLDLSREGYEILRRMGERDLSIGALNNMGNAAADLGDLEGGRRYLMEALDMGRASGNTDRTASALHCLGALEISAGRYDDAAGFAEEALALFTRVGNRSSCAMLLQQLARIALARGEFASARWHAESSLALRRELRDLPGTIGSLEELARIAEAAGSRSESIRYVAELVGAYRRAGRTDAAIDQMRRLAAEALAAGSAELAARILGSAESLRGHGGDTAAQASIQTSVLVARIRAALGEPAYASALRQGRGMSPEEAAALALEMTC